jgi:hypothetical protein
MKDDVCARSFVRITKADLCRLATLAQDYFDDLFARRPQGAGRFRGRLLLLALCQGAALHYVDRSTGVKDFDVWGFFKSHPSLRFPSRGVRGHCDFKNSRFGRHPKDRGYEGRRVDVLGRAVDVRRGENGIAALRRYLANGRPDSSPWHLAKRPVIAIYPDAILGHLVWLPPTN